MSVLEIYKCLCDETRLRILHLLSYGPLCVCHFQSILGVGQVSVSKHLKYLRIHGLVDTARREQWMIYHLPTKRTRELDLQLACLQDCVGTDPKFKADVQQLKKVHSECCWLGEAVNLKKSKCC
jgi:ArsR family transcriptional regulator